MTWRQLALRREIKNDVVSHKPKKSQSCSSLIRACKFVVRGRGFEPPTVSVLGSADTGGSSSNDLLEAEFSRDN